MRSLTHLVNSYGKKNNHKRSCLIFSSILSVRMKVSISLQQNLEEKLVQETKTTEPQNRVKYVKTTLATLRWLLILNHYVAMVQFFPFF